MFWRLRGTAAISLIFFVQNEWSYCESKDLDICLFGLSMVGQEAVGLGLASVNQFCLDAPDGFA